MPKAFFVGEKLDLFTKKMVEKSEKFVILAQNLLLMVMEKHFILLVLNLFIFSSCASPTPEPGDEPLNLADGKLIIKFADPKLEAKPTITIAKDEVLAVSLNIKKAVDGSFPVKMAVYITDVLRKKGF